MKRKEHRDECYSELPLRQFKKGQPLRFKKVIGSGFHVDCPGKFAGIERGMVLIQIEPEKENWTPEWYDRRSLEKLAPGNIMKVRPSSCYVWGMNSGDMRPRCHWFHDLDSSVNPTAKVEASIDWMQKLLEAPAVKALEE